jgi:hypothetical protein
MKFEQPPEQKMSYTVQGEDLKNVELNRDDVLEEAALVLDNDPDFPDTRGEKADHLRAKRAIRDAIKKHGTLDDKFEKQIDSDAYEVLDLFKKK